MNSPLDILITGAVLLDPAEGCAQSAFLGISGQKIVQVGLGAEVPPAAARHLHLPGRVIVPGFINTHYHAGLKQAYGCSPASAWRMWISPPCCKAAGASTCSAG